MTVIDTKVRAALNGSMDTAEGPKKNELSKDDFMKLFLTQLRMQDPLKPTSNSEMMQQMAQFTSLSSAQELQKTIKGLNANMGKSQVLEASQLIGKNVQMPSKSAYLSGEKGLEGSVIMPAASNALSVTITDSNNQVVKTINLSAPSSGVVDFKWDGLDAEGNQLNPDYYHLSASAMINGESVAVPTAGTFRVNSVGLDQNNGGVILNLDGMGGVGMNDIIKIV
ncbi:MAG: flagellar hook assembly protein FlgD [Gammaproteobacteria bacterium]|nr:flagellar hook assembly protein FlgD [Gammaproteobacteria bacterium]